MRRAFFGLAFLAVMAIPFAAQAQGSERAFVRGFFGATFGQVGGGAVGAGVGFKLSDNIQITGEFGRLSNVIPKSVSDDVDQTAAEVAADIAIGGKASSSSNAKAAYGMVGVRVKFHEISNGVAYIEAGAGMAHVTSSVTAEWRNLTAQGRLEGLVHTPFTDATPENKPIVALGAGLSLPVTSTSAIEMGYRFATINTVGTAINTSKVYGGLRIGF